MIAEHLSGRTLGQYHLLEVIGKGGMGIVYRAVRPGVSGEVAIKVLSTSSPDYIRRFKQEAEIASRLRHPHIVRVYDSGTLEGLSYVVMQLLTGGSLGQRLSMGRGEKYPSMPLTRVTQIIQQVASALDYAHSQGVIHRDVKTSNILFDDKDTPYLVDFGVAKITTHNATSLTSSGMIVGTLPYVAPEQLRDDPLTQAVDQYALAVMAYYILSGRMPFTADSTYAIMQKLLFEEPTSLSKYRTDLSEQVMEVISRGMAKKVEDRYPSAGAFAAAFTNAISSTKPVTQRRTGEYATIPTTQTDIQAVARQKRNRRTWVFLLLALLLAAAGAGIASQTSLFINPSATAETTAKCSVRPKISANVRFSPDDTSADNVLRAYTADQSFEVNAKTTDAKGELWWRIYLPQFSDHYWVADKVVNQSGNCDTITTLAAP